MPNDPSFELIEDAAFTGSLSWRLKGNHIHFRGRNGNGAPLSPRRPVPARDKQIGKFVAALDFLQVWDWKSDYNPVECGDTVCDGMTWSFTALIHGRQNVKPVAPMPTRRSPIRPRRRLIPNATGFSCSRCGRHFSWTSTTIPASRSVA